MNFPSKSGVQVAARLLLHGRFQVLKDAERMRQDMLARLVQVAAAKECDNQLNSCSATQVDLNIGNQGRVTIFGFLRLACLRFPVPLPLLCLAAIYPQVVAPL